MRTNLVEPNSSAIKNQATKKVMTMGTQATAHDDDMPSEIDFSKGTRGKFHQPGMRLNLPVYLDDQVQATLSALANAKGIELSTLVNDLLKKDIELIELGR
jgi:hypothetical protein